MRQADKPSTACIIMASGRGKRFGGNKLLADFGGSPLIDAILSVTGQNLFSDRLILTIHPEIADLCREKNINVLLHREPLRNQAIRLGMEHMIKSAPDGCMFCPADQPLLSRESLKAMLSAFSAHPDRIHRLSFQGMPGSPILFPSRLFPELLTLPDKCGGSFLAEKYPEQVHLVPAQDKYELYDVDTKEDLSLLLRFVLRDQDIQHDSHQGSGNDT